MYTSTVGTSCSLFCSTSTPIRLSPNASKTREISFPSCKSRLWNINHHLPPDKLLRPGILYRLANFSFFFSFSPYGKQRQQRMRTTCASRRRTSICLFAFGCVLIDICVSKSEQRSDGAAFEARRTLASFPLSCVSLMGRNLHICCRVRFSLCL